MTESKPNQSGFTVVEAIIILVVIAVIAGVGWLVYSKQHKKNTNESASTTSLKQPASTSKPEASTKPDPYAGWKSYTLRSEKLTFKYPKSWTISDVGYATGNQDYVAFKASDGFTLSVDDGQQNGGDPRALASNDPVPVSFLGKTAYLTFAYAIVAHADGPGNPDTSAVGGAVLLTDPNNQYSYPSDKNVIGNSANTTNGPSGSAMIISMGYGSPSPTDSSNKKMTIQAAKADSEYKNAELVIESAHY